MARLHSIRIAGWKSIRATDPPITLGSITVLIGANGSGKSNFVSFFNLLHEHAEERLQAYIGKLGGGASVLHFGPKQTPMMEAQLEVDTPNGRCLYILRLAHAAADTLVVNHEAVSFLRGDEEASPYEHFGSPFFNHAKPSNSLAQTLHRLIWRCRVYHFHDTSDTARIRLSGYIEDNQQLAPDAGNLAAMLYLYRQRHERVYRRIVSTIRKIVPGFDSFVLEPQRLNPANILLNWKQVGSDYLFGPHQLSDGSLRAIALTTLFLQPEADLPDVIVLDEPELGLHPQAVEFLAGMICGVSHRAQVILATQSPTFVDQFEPEDVLVTDIHEGQSRFRRLDADELANWLADYSVGELWQKNVIGGGPVP